MPNKAKRSPTMKDVARLAGVSQTTVSFVINETPYSDIPDETKRRVLEAAKQLGYRPNAMAQGLRRQRTNTIGFITDEIASTPYAGQMVEGAQDAAWGHDKILLLVNTKGNYDIEDAAIEMLLNRRVEGIIYATMYHRGVTPPQVLREVPTVLLDCFAEDRSFPSVVPEEAGGGRAATEYLLKKGHRRVAFINHSHAIPATSGRLQGYREALDSYSIPYDGDLVWVGESESEGGYNGTMKLMQLPNPPTAIFCFNDRAAMGAYDALRKLGLSIPRDVAVIGFDNQEVIAAHLYPPLTTMQLPHYAMGEWAVRHLTVLMEWAGNSNPVQHRIECPLVERESA